MSEEDMELEKDLGTPEERQRILSAIKYWANNHPDKDAQIVLTQIDMRTTPGEIVQHMEDETAIGVAVLDVLVLESRKLKEISESEIVKFLGPYFPHTDFRKVAGE